MKCNVCLARLITSKLHLETAIKIASLGVYIFKVKEFGNFKMYTNCRINVPEYGTFSPIIFLFSMRFWGLYHRILEETLVSHRFRCVCCLALEIFHERFYMFHVVRHDFKQYPGNP